MHSHRLRPRALLATLAVLALAAAALAAPSQVRSAAPASVGDTQIAGDATGDMVAAWTRGASIQVAVKPAAGTAWAAPQTLVQMSFPIGFWSLAVGHDGLALLVWERRIGAASTIWARTLQLPGSNWSSAVRVSGPAGVGVRGAVQAAVAGDGRAIAVWRERNGKHWVLIGATRGATAAAWSGPVQAAGSACISPYAPELSAAGSGPALATWVCFTRSGHPPSLRGVQLDATGAFGPAFTLAH